MEAEIADPSAIIETEIKEESLQIHMTIQGTQNVSTVHSTDEFFECFHEIVTVSMF